MKLAIAVPEDFSFRSTVFSHGWCALPPYKVLKDTRCFRGSFTIPGGPVVLADISEDNARRPALGAARPAPGRGRSAPATGRPIPNAGRLTLTINSPTASLTASQKRQLTSVVRACFRLDEGMDEFHAHARKYPGFRWVSKKRAGRMLRSQTVFEDVVKMICTTNCSWELTTVMITNMCRKLGVQTAEGEYGFPAPAVLADCSEKFIRKEVRAGYRAPYLREFAKQVATGALHTEHWRGSSLPTEELFEEVRSVKGVGPYAAGNILKLLGRYDYLGVDSWCRKKFLELHGNGRRPGVKRLDKQIEKFYAPFGKWQGLFFWMDMTKDWYDRDFPF
jgi:N-glycosylase/DNA lyase